MGRYNSCCSGRVLEAATIGVERHNIYICSLKVAPAEHIASTAGAPENEDTDGSDSEGTACASQPASRVVGGKLRSALEVWVTRSEGLYVLQPAAGAPWPAGCVLL